MEENRFSRRAFLGVAALTPSALNARQIKVPWSAGMERPRTKAPLNAADCHHHVYDSRFPVDPKAVLRPGDATVADYRLLQKRIGIQRHVVVQPSTYAFDNSCLLDALKQFGPAARGIAVINPEVSDEQIKELDAAGVKGIRFTLSRGSVTSLDMVEPLAKRIAALGWHIQVNGTAETIMPSIDILSRIPVPVVFDHLAHAMAPDTPLVSAVAKLLQGRKAWVKLSGAYLDTKTGPPCYVDSSEVAKAYIKEAPERLIWGSDWPHPSVTVKPDDALLFDLLGQWASDEELLRRILVENPTTLYDFS